MSRHTTKIQQAETITQTGEPFFNFKEYCRIEFPKEKIAKSSPNITPYYPVKSINGGKKYPVYYAQ